MSVYVGIDVHRKRSQVAVVTGDGDGRAQQERGERLRADAAADRRPGRRDAGGVRGRVRLGVAGRTARGLRLRGAPGAPAAVQGDRLGPAEERQGPAPRPWPSCCARTCSRRRGSRRRRSGSYLSGPGRGWLAELELPVASREIVADCLAVTGRPGGEGPGRPSPPLPAVEVHRRDTGRRDHPNANHGTRPLPDSEALTTPNVTKHMRRSGGGHVETAWKPRGACPGPSAE